MAEIIEMGRTSSAHMLGEEVQEDLGRGRVGEPSARAASPANRNEPPTWLTLVLYYAGAVVAGLLTGIETNVVGGVLATRPFLNQFLPEEWLRQSHGKQSVVCRYVNVPILLLNSAYFMAALPSFLLASFVYSKFRGNKLLLFGAMFHLIGHGFHFRTEISFLIAGRIFVGIGVGIITLAFQVLVHHVSHGNHKNIIENIYAYAIVLGGPMAYIINTIGNLHYANIAWKISFMFTFPFSILLFIFSCFYCFYGFGSNIDMEISLHSSISSLFKEENKKKSIISVVKEITIPLIDFGLFMGWIPVILLSLNVTVEVTFYVTLTLSLVQCVFICLSPLFIKFLSRRYMLISSGSAIIVTQALIGVLMVTSGNLQVGYPIKNGIAILVFVAIFQVCMGCLATVSGWLKDPLPDESKFGSLFCFQCINYIMQIGTAWAALPLFCKLKGFTVFFLLGIVGITLTLIYFLVEEEEDDVE